MIKGNFVALVSALLLASCADIDIRNTTSTEPTAVRLVLQEDASLLGARYRTEFLRLREMTMTSPDDDRLWVGIARIYFENENYGKAIVYAGEVLKRDPDHLEARSLIAVGGLRAAHASVDSLRRQHLGNSGNTAEGRALTDLLRVTLGEGLLFPGKRDENMQ